MNWNNKIQNIWIKSKSLLGIMNKNIYIKIEIIIIKNVQN